MLFFSAKVRYITDVLVGSNAEIKINYYKQNQLSDRDTGEINEILAVFGA